MLGLGIPGMNVPSVVFVVIRLAVVLVAHHPRLKIRAVLVVSLVVSFLVSIFVFALVIVKQPHSSHHHERRVGLISRRARMLGCRGFLWNLVVKCVLVICALVICALVICVLMICVLVIT